MDTTIIYLYPFKKGKFGHRASDTEKMPHGNWNYVKELQRLPETHQELEDRHGTVSPS